MSDPAGHMPDREALAAEYVLGTLPLAERLTAEALIASDVNFASLVADWQARLAVLDDDYKEATPPRDMLQRIESRLFPEAARPKRGWLWGAGAGLALAVLALVVFLPPATPPEPAVTATLTGEGQELAVQASYDPQAGALTVRRTAGPAAGAGQDYELWLIPEGQDAQSIGLVRDGDLEIPLDTLPEGATLAITLEPQGGSPTGVATGPLLVAAVISGG
ncbi:MAG: anti-sigma factor [Paracoccaceae bacterium]